MEKRFFLPLPETNGKMVELRTLKRKEKRAGRRKERKEMKKNEKRELCVC